MSWARAPPQSMLRTPTTPGLARLAAAAAARAVAPLRSYGWRTLPAAALAVALAALVLAPVLPLPPALGLLHHKALLSRLRR